MTNTNAVSAEIAPYTAEPAVIDKACWDEGVEPTDTYSVALKVDIAKVAIRVLRKFIVLANESEGGYSIGYDPKALLVRIQDIASENGLTEEVSTFARPKVQNRSNRW